MAPPDVARTWLVVTAALDEAANLPSTAAALAATDGDHIALWVIVDDGSTDGTAEVAEGLQLPFPHLVLRRQQEGGLEHASELGAFREGAVAGLAREPDVRWVMKLDADIRLAADHLTVLDQVGQEVGVVGGVIDGLSERVQSDHVRGGLRGYSRPAWEVARELPAALGWDVLDLVAVRRAGMQVRCLPAARASTVRRTGSSVGLLRGRRRAGIVSRWTGYLAPYFALRVVRTALQRPVGLGAVALLVGYATAGRSPFAEDLREAHRREQRAKLGGLVRRPLAEARRLYGRR